ncbi:hypothetical protein EJ06DRAFT_539540 [Trichodelitschia bisporula]|uniref:Peptidase M43 pregnancy-associated plasma-A domain-containing protein n=1 Tax=Trichodelitschia bisporula TaxID=703511 RepID=A0A6G1HMM5_9PEZI|nr:hypothetical protein EJ06DRAFT_539540 [Trichodelitschia bisporula]
MRALLTSSPPSSLRAKYTHFACGHDASTASPEFLSTVKSLHDAHKPGPGSPAIATIPTVFHIVLTTAHNGTINATHVAGQIAALNKAYGPRGALRVGGYSTVNLDFVSDLDGAFWALLYADGGGGGGFSDYGMTAVHETGHWLRPLHVFEGETCGGDGDFIADTPVQSTSTDGCRTSPEKDSGSRLLGVDSVHNVMDYSADACYTGFSPGQVERMKTMWGLYQGGK